MNKNASVARYNIEIKKQNGENWGITLWMPILTKLEGDLDDADLDGTLDVADLVGTLDDADADAGDTGDLQINIQRDEVSQI